MGEQIQPLKCGFRSGGIALSGETLNFCGKALHDKSARGKASIQVRIYSRLASAVTTIDARTPYLAEFISLIC
jgi:hypothetical protein